MRELITWKTLLISFVWPILSIVGAGLQASAAGIAGQFIGAFFIAFLVVHGLKGLWIGIRGSSEQDV
jgi:hypothetical protein